MASSDLLALVRQLDDAIARCDVQALRDGLVAPSVEWFVPGRHPLAGPKRGPDEVVAYHDLMDQARVRRATRAIAAIDGETVVRLQHVTGETAGVGLDSMELLVYTCGDGRVAQVQAFLGDQHPVDLFYWAAFRLQPVPDRLAD